jgi:hypothetical protein
MRKQAAHQNSILVQNRFYVVSFLLSYRVAANYPSQHADERRTGFKEICQHVVVFFSEMPTIFCVYHPPNFVSLAMGANAFR